MPTAILRRAPRSSKLASGLVRKMADRMLSSLDLVDAELSVLLTDDARIQVLNRQHRGKDRPTDVLSFPMDESEAREGARVLGDVVISLDTALRQARARKRDLASEVRFLLAHGLLHLVGYDHATAAQKRKMVAATRRLVRAATTFELHVVRHRKSTQRSALRPTTKRLQSRNRARARHTK